MSALQGIVDYPGLNGQFKSADYCHTNGVEPGICTIEMPQEVVPNLAQTGDLTFTYGDQTVTLPNCYAETANVAASQGGFIARVAIKDRRWAWKFGSISGHWNQRMPSGTCADEEFNGAAVQIDGDATKIRSGTELAPQNIATNCLNLMGEQNFDLSALPSDARPEINWSHANPAHALEELCEGLGCRVSYVLESDSVVIVTIGQGNPLPDNGQQQWVSYGMSAPALPTAMRVVGGPTVWQGFLPLEAVGIDADGSINPIDSLTYAPSAGWGSDLTFSTITNPIWKALADKCLYRYWRIKIPDGGLNPPTTAASPNITIHKAAQVKLWDRQLDTHNDPNDQARIVHKRPEIWGYFENGFGQNINTPQQAQKYADHCEVDTERWLVITGDRHLQTVGGQNLPAQLYVKIAFSVRSTATWEPLRYKLRRQLSSNLQTQDHIIHREEIFLKVVGTYDDSFNLQSSTDNADADSLDDQANYYLDAELNQFLAVQSFDIPYVGIVPIQPDGLIQQVTYSITAGEGGGTLTRASLATEHNDYVKPYKTAREQRRLKEIAKEIHRNKSIRGKGDFNLSAGFNH